MSVATLITAEQYVEMHFDRPVELVRGEIVEMTQPDAPHGSVCARVAYSLSQWALPTKRGQITTNDSGVLTERAPDTMRGADVAFYPTGLTPNGKLRKGDWRLTPTLCVEVLSPSNRPKAIRTKIDEYLAVGVEEVWVVDSERHTVEVFRGDGPPVDFNEDALLTSRALPEFAVPVSEFFAGVE